MVVRGSRGHARRLLCLEDSVTECLGEGQRTAVNEGANQLPGQ